MAFRLGDNVQLKYGGPRMRVEKTTTSGGNLSVRSELGRGSTFTVRLPLPLSEEPRSLTYGLSSTCRSAVRRRAWSVPTTPSTSGSSEAVCERA